MLNPFACGWIAIKGYRRVEKRFPFRIFLIQSLERCAAFRRFCRSVKNCQELGQPECRSDGLLATLEVSVEILAVRTAADRASIYFARMAEFQPNSGR